MREKEISPNSGSVSKVLVSLAAIHSIAPGLLNTIVYGNKGDLVLGEGINMAGTIIAIFFALALLWKLLLLNDLRLLQLNLRPLMISLLPWLSVLISAVIASNAIGIQFIIYPLLMLYLASTGMGMDYLRYVAVSIIVIAVVTIAISFWYPQVAYFTADKSTILNIAHIGKRGLLAGTYSHPNLLGTIMCLGVANSFYLGKKMILLSIALTGTVILLSGSRTSLICFIIIIVSSVFSNFQPQIARTALRIALLVTGALAVIVPLFQISSGNFSGRTQIWDASIKLWPKHPLFGGGPSIYSQLRMVAGDFGIYAFNGHNLFINTMTTLGVIGFISYMIYILYCFKALRKLKLMNDPVVLWLLSFLIISISEVRFDLSNLGQVGFVTWFGFGYLFFSSHSVARN